MPSSTILALLIHDASLGSGQQILIAARSFLTSNGDKESFVYSSTFWLRGILMLRYPTPLMTSRRRFTTPSRRRRWLFATLARRTTGLCCRPLRVTMRPLGSLPRSSSTRPDGTPVAGSRGRHRIHRSGASPNSLPRRPEINVRECRIPIARFDWLMAVRAGRSLHRVRSRCR